jgi:hypothetical protein
MTNTVTAVQPESLEIISKLGDLYGGAVDHIITTIGIVAGLIGVIIPLMVAFFQYRAAKNEEEKLRSLVKLEMEQARQDLKNTFAIEIEAIRKEFTQDIDKRMQKVSRKVASMDGWYLIKNGQECVAKKIGAMALKNFSEAGSLFIKSEDDQGIQACIKNMDDAFKILTSEDLEISNFGAEAAFLDFIEQLKKVERTTAFTTSVIILASSFELAKKKLSPRK